MTDDRGTAAASERRRMAQSFLRQSQFIVMALALTVWACGAFVLLVGWALGNAAATHIIADLPAMVPSTAFLFIVASLAILSDLDLARTARRRLQHGASLLIALVAAANLLVMSLSSLSGIDQALFSDMSGLGEDHMSLGTSLSFLLAAVAIARLRERQGADRIFVSSATTGLLVSLLAIVGSAFHVESLYAITVFANMALHTALCFAAAFSALLLLRPARGWMGVLSGRGAGSAAARHIMPTILILPFATCLTVLAALDADYFDYPFGLSLIAIGMVITLTAMSLLDAQKVNRLEENHFAQVRALARRQAMAQAGQASEDNFRELAEALPVAVYQTSSEGLVTYANRQMQELTGHDLDHLLGNDLRDLLKPCPTDYSKCSQTQAVFPGEGQCFIIGEQVIWAVNETRPFHRLEDGDPGMIGTLQDVSENRKALGELRAARDAAQAAAHAKSTFLANMSHEIRTPMNGILGFAELLMESDTDPRRRQYAKLIHDSGKSLVKILNDILDLSKIEAGKLVLREEPFDLGGAITRTAQLMRGAAQHKQIALDLSLDPALPCQVFGDELRLGQILTNLVGNAIKFSDRGSVRIDARCDDRMGTRWLTVTVTDQGIGIDPERLESLFGEFVQDDTGRMRQHGGTGLGLPIARRLAETMGGRLTLDSTPGEGTVAKLEVPVVVAGGSGAVKRRAVA
ncbi:PAS domain-containing protein [Alteraurantiacibacter aquimixticola]|uniref:PAS domain-containing protein n=1 Tax=Alteraurantiacibacter aquimixticola TaxID=2489173 RepID=UPI00145AA1B1|nr:PAS domain-containing protein [Alteraurantiacibacter aquimixticola]